MNWQPQSNGNWYLWIDNKLAAIACADGRAIIGIGSGGGSIEERTASLAAAKAWCLAHVSP
jgi:hypothetical protein